MLRPISLPRPFLCTGLSRLFLIHICLYIFLLSFSFILDATREVKSFLLQKWTLKNVSQRVCWESWSTLLGIKLKSSLIMIFFCSPDIGRILSDQPTGNTHPRTHTESLYYTHTNRITLLYIHTQSHYITHTQNAVTWCHCGKRKQTNEQRGKWRHDPKQQLRTKIKISTSTLIKVAAVNRSFLKKSLLRQKMTNNNNTKIKKKDEKRMETVMITASRVISAAIK